MINVSPPQVPIAGAVRDIIDSIQANVGNLEEDYQTQARVNLAIAIKLCWLLEDASQHDDLRIKLKDIDEDLRAKLREIDQGWADNFAMKQLMTDGANNPPAMSAAQQGEEEDNKRAEMLGAIGEIAKNIRYCADLLQADFADDSTFNAHNIIDLCELVKRATPHQWELDAKQVREQHARLNPDWKEQQEADND
jgi:hypothetical protein